MDPYYQHLLLPALFRYSGTAPQLERALLGAVITFSSKLVLPGGVAHDMSHSGENKTWENEVAAHRSDERGDYS